jgi:hypothetical protein
MAQLCVILAPNVCIKWREVYCLVPDTNNPYPSRVSIFICSYMLARAFYIQLQNIVVVLRTDQTRHVFYWFCFPLFCLIEPSCMVHSAPRQSFCSTCRSGQTSRTQAKHNQQCSMVLTAARLQIHTAPTKDRPARVGIYDKPTHPAIRPACGC